MSRRTINIPSELEQKIRVIRAQLLVKHNRDYSASQVTVLLLENAVKDWKSQS